MQNAGAPQQPTGPGLDPLSPTTSQARPLSLPVVPLVVGSDPDEHVGVSPEMSLSPHAMGETQILRSKPTTASGEASGSDGPRTSSIPRLLGVHSLLSVNNASRADLWEDLQKEVAGSREEHTVKLLGRNFTLATNIRIAGFVHTTISLLSVAVAVANFKAEERQMDFALSALTVLLLCVVVYSSVQKFRQLRLWKAEWHIRYRNVFVSPLCGQLMVEFVANALHCPPFFTDMWGPDARILNCFVLLRTTTLLRTVTSRVRVYSSSGGALVGAVTGQSIDTFFVYKVMLFQHPGYTVGFTCLWGFLVLGTAVWLAESRASGWTYGDCMWYTMVTFTTVGYGDLAPRTEVGKIIGCVSAIFGIVVGAVLISVVQHQFSLTRLQKQMIMFLCEVQHASALKTTAATVVTSAIEYRRAQRVLQEENDGVLPPHKSVTTIVFGSAAQRLLYCRWRKLRDSASHLRRLRSGKEGGVGWADISVLDVLHADPSDILAQNTVLQYLMRPADEDLSSQLRKNKPRNIAPVRRSSVQSRDALQAVGASGSPRGTPTPPASARTHEPRPLALSTSTNDMASSMTQPQRSSIASAADKYSVPAQPIRVGSVGRGLGRRGSVSSMASRSSVASTVGVRTAASTRNLVEMLKTMVVNPDPQPAPLVMPASPASRRHTRPQRRESLGRDDSNASMAGMYAALQQEQQQSLEDLDARPPPASGQDEGAAPTAPSPRRAMSRRGGWFTRVQAQQQCGSGDELVPTTDDLEARAPSSPMQSPRMGALPSSPRRGTVADQPLINELRARQELLTQRLEEQSRLVAAIFSHLQASQSTTDTRSPSVTSPTALLQQRSPPHARLSGTSPRRGTAGSQRLMKKRVGSRCDAESPDRRPEDEDSEDPTVTPVTEMLGPDEDE